MKHASDTSKEEIRMQSEDTNIVLGTILLES